jgi:DNA-binding response OmpR family regulator
MNTILLSGDSTAELKKLGQYLGRQGYGIFLCSTSELAEMADKHRPDVIVYDGKLEEKPDLSIGVKEKERIPVLVLIEEQSLEMLRRYRDIDDFVLKPVNAEELTERIRLLLWRASRLASEDLIKAGDVVIDLESYQVSVGSELISLTLKEFELLKFLASHRGKVYTREFLLNQIWGYDYYGGMRTVDVHVRRLRSKIEVGGETYIETVRGVGYRFK